MFQNVCMSSTKCFLFSYTFSGCFFIFVSGFAPHCTTLRQTKLNWQWFRFGTSQKLTDVSQVHEKQRSAAWDALANFPVMVRPKSWPLEGILIRKEGEDLDAKLMRFSCRIHTCMQAHETLSCLTFVQEKKENTFRTFCKKFLRCKAKCNWTCLVRGK